MILPLAKQLLQEVDYEHHPIRLIGLSVSNPREEGEEKGCQYQEKPTNESLATHLRHTAVYVQPFLQIGKLFY